MRWLRWKIQRNRKRLTVVTVLHHVYRLFVLKLRCVSFGAQHKPIYYTVTRYLSTNGMKTMYKDLVRKEKKKNLDGFLSRVEFSRFVFKISFYSFFLS